MDMIGLLFEAPPLALQLVIDGVLIGAIFALIAYGMALVWGVMKIVNICQGEFVILGGYISYYVWQAGYPLAIGVPAAALALFLLGWLLYRTIIFRVVEQDLFISILATFGLAILLAQLMNQAFGADVRTADAGFGNWFLFDNLVSIAAIKLVSFGVTGIVAALLIWFMRRTRFGQAIRATAQNARAARILGIDTHSIYAFTYGLNAAICGAAGALIAMIWVIAPFGGLIYTLRAFMIVIVAGIGNLPGVIAAGLGLGIIEQFIGFVLGAQFQIALIFVLLVIILVWRSQLLRRRRKVLE
ncbi:MAG: branched-chain amino acid ABC transporter permease [Dongiaceae bacterium]